MKRLRPKNYFSTLFPSTPHQRIFRQKRMVTYKAFFWPIPYLSKIDIFALARWLYVNISKKKIFDFFGIAWAEPRFSVCQSIWLRPTDRTERNYDLGTVSKDRVFFYTVPFVEFSILPISVRFLFPVKWAFPSFPMHFLQYDGAWWYADRYINLGQFDD